MERKRSRLKITPKQKVSLERKYVVIAVSSVVVVFAAFFIYQTFGIANFNLAKAEEADCSGQAQGDETSYGNGEWIAYAYNKKNNFASENYRGNFIETERFDERFCGANCDFTTNGCDVKTETFSVKFKMRKTFNCGVYDITLGGDDAIRLSMDGGNTYVINQYHLQVYKRYTVRLALEGSYDMVIDYWENKGNNRVSFDYNRVGDVYEGLIGSSQEYCSKRPVDAEPFTSISEAIVCGATITYQWQQSTDSLNFTNITNATAATYTPPTGLTSTVYYRRTATDGDTLLVSNVVKIDIEVPPGDETTYGQDEWIGYVYNKVRNYQTANYRGYITEPAIFDQGFGGNNRRFSTNGCHVRTQTFSVRFKMQKHFDCGVYTLTLGGDDGVRLSLDGGRTYVINKYKNQPYTTYTTEQILDGTYDMVIEYYEQGGGNRVSFNYVLTDTKYSGKIGNDQIFCTSPVDPDALTSIEDALICGETLIYQWQSSSDSINFSNISGANAAAYDPPSGLTTTTYYRRRAIGGTDTVYSDTVQVSIRTIAGDRVSYGYENWIGYVYDKARNFNEADYKGSLPEPAMFEENFGGNRRDFAIEGCPIYTETFTVRFKMLKSFEAGHYTFTIGADDGVRLSLDGGNTFIIDDWSNHSYRTRSSASIMMAGNYEMVLDYYEQGGGNRISFNYVQDSRENILPIELMYFKAETETPGEVTLSWKTLAERDNDYFTIERGESPTDMEPIAEVTGAGTSSTGKEYEYIDTKPIPGRSYYRLKQTDFDGTSETFDMVTVDVEGGHVPLEIVQVSPNPFSDRFKIALNAGDGEVSMVLIGSNGGMVKHEVIRTTMGVNQIELDGLQSLQEGIYILKIEQEGSPGQTYKLYKKR